MIIHYGPNSVSAISPNGFATLMVQRDAVHSLKGNGDPATLRAVCRRAEALCIGDTMVCVVEHDNPLKDRLIRLYAKFGFRDIGLILKKDM